MQKIKMKRWMVYLAGLLLLWLFGIGGIALMGMQEQAGRGDLLIIPGNTVELSGKPSPRLAARLEAGWRAWQANCCRAIMVSGGIGVEGFDEAQVMAQWLIAKGVPRDAVLIDSLGNNTRATVENAGKILRERHFETVLIASQYFHLPRMQSLLKEHGMKCAGQYPAKYYEARDIYSINRELIALLALMVS